MCLLECTKYNLRLDIHAVYRYLENLVVVHKVLDH